MRELSWYKCYKEGWQGEIVPEAFSHPAKFARGLIRKIYEYAIEQGYLKEGQTVFDPFAGVALGGLDAMFHGLHFIGCELEDKFVQLGQQNIDLWNRRYGNGKLRRWGTAVILQGDSRRLCEVLDGARAEGIIASPPYSNQTIGSKTYIERMERLCQQPIESLAPRWQREVRKYLRVQQATSHCQITDEGYGETEGNLGNMPTGEPPSAIVSSPPLGKAQSGGTSFWEGLEEKHGREFSDRVREGSQGYREDQLGDSDGQLGAMPTGEPPQAVIGSPPHGIAGVGHDAGHPRLDTVEDARREAEGCRRRPAYGQSNGQLAAMHEGDVDAVIASPPYSESTIKDQRGQCVKGGRILGGRLLPEVEGYGDSDGQLAALPEGEPPQAIVSSPPWGRKVAQAVNVPDVKIIRPSLPPANEVAQYLRDSRKVKGLSIKQVNNLLGTKAMYGWFEKPRLPSEIPTPTLWRKLKSILGLDDRFDQGILTKEIVRARWKDTVGRHNLIGEGYGTDPTNLGNQQGDTFWSAARAILLQCHAVLAPGGVAIFVTKRFVRGGKIIEFSQQWADLCQSCGFEFIEWIKAWLVEERGTQYDLEGEAHTKTVKRFSFFRRLHAQKYPHLAIEWEDILIFRKPV